MVEHFISGLAGIVRRVGKRKGPVPDYAASPGATNFRSAGSGSSRNRRRSAEIPAKKEKFRQLLRAPPADSVLTSGANCPHGKILCLHDKKIFPFKIFPVPFAEDQSLGPPVCEKPKMLTTMSS
jgi:hypothetical protein